MVDLPSLVGTGGHPMPVKQPCPGRGRGGGQQRPAAHDGGEVEGSGNGVPEPPPGLIPSPGQSLQCGNLGVGRQLQGCPAEGHCQRPEPGRQHRGPRPEAPPPAPDRGVGQVETDGHSAQADARNRAGQRRSDHAGGIETPHEQEGRDQGMTACARTAAAPADPDPVHPRPATHEPPVARPVDQRLSAVRANPTGPTDPPAGSLVGLDIHGAGPYDRDRVTALDPPVSASSSLGRVLRFSGPRDPRGGTARRHVIAESGRIERCRGGGLGGQAVMPVTVRRLARFMLRVTHHLELQASGPTSDRRVGVPPPWVSGPPPA
ncbi:MAG: hypothetical protein QOJ93_3072 [Actinomycetota bacterium]|nr:hypothetical protein [Actinomycetota bacterium]